MAEYIALMGPTCMGKTQLLLDCHKALGDCFEVVNVDSVQVYKGLNIGSAKINAEMAEILPHHLIDEVMPWEHFDVACFIEKAHKAIHDISSRGKVAVLAGGSMLYFHLLKNGLHASEAIDTEVKLKVSGLITEGRSWQMLEALDPKFAAHLKPQDKQRIQRGLEYFYQHGQPISQIHGKKEYLLPPFHAKKTLHFVCQDRDELKYRAQLRLTAMFQDGLVDELSQVLKSSPVTMDLSFSSLRSIGYQQVWRYLQNEWSLDRAKELSYIATCQYIKRQLTWLRSWKGEVVTCSDAVDMQKQLMQSIVPILA